MKMKILLFSTLFVLACFIPQAEAKFYSYFSYHSGKNHYSHDYGFKEKYGYYPKHFRNHGKAYYKGYPYKGYYHPYESNRHTTYVRANHHGKRYYYPYYDDHHYEYFFSRKYGRVYVKYPKHHQGHDHGHISSLDYHYCR